MEEQQKIHIPHIHCPFGGYCRWDCGWYLPQANCCAISVLGALAQQEAIQKLSTREEK